MPWPVMRLKRYCKAVVAWAIVTVPAPTILLVPFIELPRRCTLGKPVSRLVSAHPGRLETVSYMLGGARTRSHRISKPRDPLGLIKSRSDKGRECSVVEMVGSVMRRQTVEQNTAQREG